MNCQFCNRTITNRGSLAAHVNRCSQNPDRVFYSRSPMAGAQRGNPSPHRGKRNPIRSAQYREQFPDSVVFVENSTYPRHSIKRRIIEDDLIPYVCACCGGEPMWQGKPLVLILDHVNGVNNDNRLENLRFVCSNCDSQLPTYKSKNRSRS